MMKEKTVVCIGIFLILAVLTSCALFYNINNSCSYDSADDMGISCPAAGTAVLNGHASGTESGGDGNILFTLDFEN
ncbi:MAG: hypothetical protein ACOX68_01280 [Candidatus Limivicinus sp.]|jgi:hypothetical protein